ncbi:MAG TPA: hypothetical protein VIV60_30265, partial [Polyangiaceae bacterium]
MLGKLRLLGAAHAAHQPRARFGAHRIGLAAAALETRCTSPAAGVLVESTGKKRDRSFVYRAYLDRLKVGTELGRSTQ